MRSRYSKFLWIIESTSSDFDICLRAIAIITRLQYLEVVETEDLEPIVFLLKVTKETPDNKDGVHV